MRRDCGGQVTGMKKSLKLILGALCAYVLLLILLLAAEARAPGASIRSFGDAIWYSLITMTTVGYGDLSPVTPLGRVLGILFALCSIGILTALIGVGLKLIGGAFVPRQRLRRGREKKWYAFFDESSEAKILAAALLKEDPGCLVIFPEEEENGLSGSGVIHMDFSEETLLHLRKKKEGLSFFYMSAEPWMNYSRALDTAKTGMQCYCMADFQGETLPPELHLFSPNDAMSRCYWQEHPLMKSERTVLLIGCGAGGSAILERALLTNVFEKGRTVTYHVFDDAGVFAALHPEIVKALGSGEEENDGLFFHREDWREARELIQTADRILVCRDSDRENYEIVESLKSWYLVPGRLHARLSEAVPGVESFGGLEQSFTPEYVMKDEVNRRAILLNDIYNEGAENPVAWRELSPFLRQSNIAAADHLIVKVRYLLGNEEIRTLTDELCREACARFTEIRKTQADTLQEMEHRRWLRFYQMYNWKYSPVRDNRLRQHPQMLPYEQLDEANKSKDLFAWEMLGRFG